MKKLLKKDLLIENAKLKRKLEHSDEILKVSASRDKGNTSAITGLVQEKKDMIVGLDRIKALHAQSVQDNKKLKINLAYYKEIIVSFVNQMNEEDN